MASNEFATSMPAIVCINLTIEIPATPSIATDG